VELVRGNTFVKILFDWIVQRWKFGFAEIGGRSCSKVPLQKEACQAGGDLRRYRMAMPKINQYLISCKQSIHACELELSQRSMVSKPNCIQ
jgi:hypothetical protein